MKKFTFLLALLTILGLNVSCERSAERGTDDIQREEAVDDLKDGADELGDEIEDGAEELDN